MKAFCKVYGHGVTGVQHVGFRRFITEKARTLGAYCEAKNNTVDHSVELIISGPSEAVFNTIDAAKKGTLRARVLQVVCEFWEQ